MKQILKYFKLAKYHLLPICRSITGKGTLKTLKIIKKNFSKFKIYKIQSNTKVFDWSVPLEWNIKQAFIIDKNKKKILDFKNNNLHVVSYSSPVNKNIKFNDLLKKIHTRPKLPNAIPYHTSYYKKYWGFCMSENDKNKLINKYNKNDFFKVVIDSNFKQGHLNYGEFLIKGKSKQEILISTYICHPSMANNELSGPIVSMSLINYFLKKKLNKTLRFVFVPETIGSIAFLNKNLDYLKKNLIGGYNLTCIGDNRQHSCLLSKYQNSLSDQSLLAAYKKLKIKFKIYSFLKRGSDERQYNSPGVDLQITSIFRTKYGEFPEYHTSLDNFELVTPKGIYGGFNVAKTAIKILLNKKIPKSNFLCEPFMEKRKLHNELYLNMKKKSTKTIMDFLAYADGKNDLNDISKFIKKNYSQTNNIYNFLLKKKIIK
jgi:aminopeptidase-like protein